MYVCFNSQCDSSRLYFIGLRVEILLKPDSGYPKDRRDPKDARGAVKRPPKDAGVPVGAWRRSTPSALLVDRSFLVCCGFRRAPQESDCFPDRSTPSGNHRVGSIQKNPTNSFFVRKSEWVLKGE